MHINNILIKSGLSFNGVSEIHKVKIFCYAMRLSQTAKSGSFHPVDLLN